MNYQERKRKNEETSDYKTEELQFLSSVIPLCFLYIFPFYFSSDVDIPSFAGTLLLYIIYGIFIDIGQ